MSKRNENGRGGNIDTRPNQLRLVPRGQAPQLGDVVRLGNIIDHILNSGSAIIIGHTRDGGALILTILEGDTRHRTYAATADELDQALDAFEEYFNPS